jgi:hypothetical protein
VSPAIAELDVVRLRRPVGRWPEGAEGTVVGHRPGWPTATVEFAERVPLAERAGIDPDELVVDVDVSDLELVWRAATKERVRPEATRT